MPAGSSITLHSISAAWNRTHTLLACGLGATTVALMLCWIALSGHTSSQRPHLANTFKATGPPLTGDIDIWVIAGQSNAVGTNRGDSEPMPDLVAPDPERILVLNPEGAWAPAVPNIHAGVHGYTADEVYSVGCDMTFAHTLIRQGTSRRVGFVPAALGGSSLHDWRVGGELYSYMLEKVHAAMQLAPGGTLRGVIWVQGEADAMKEEALAHRYGRTLTRLVEAVRAQLSRRYNTKLVWAIALMNTWDRALCPHIAIVRQQQLDLKLPDLIKVDLQGYEFFIETWQEVSGLLHVTKNGAAAFGTAVAYAYMHYARTMGGTGLRQPQQPQQSQQLQQSQQPQQLGEEVVHDRVLQQWYGGGGRHAAGWLRRLQAGLRLQQPQQPQYAPHRKVLQRLGLSGRAAQHGRALTEEEMGVGAQGAGTAAEGDDTTGASALTGASGTLTGEFVLPGVVPRPKGTVQDAGGAAGQDSGGTDIWILAGQSNAVGQNMEDNQPIFPRSQPYPGRILMYTVGGSWQDAVPNVHFGRYGFNEQNSVGPEMSFARALIDANFSHRVGVVPTACGATNLEAWKPEGPYFKEMIDMTKKALTAMIVQYPQARLRGMIWVQGESDGHSEAASQVWGDRFKALIAEARKQLLAPDLDLVMAVMAVWDRQVVFPHLDIVRQQQLQVQLERTVKVDMEGYEFFLQQYPATPRGPIHLTKGAQGAFGEAMAYQYMEYVRSAAAPS